MTGEAADFLAAAVSPHAFTLACTERLVELRNDFVQRMASEMSYWSTWPPLTADTIHPLTPPPDPDLTALLALLLPLPLGVRAHATDVLRHLIADPTVPRTLASLSRYETRKRGLDVAESTRLIMDTGLVVPATELKGWLSGWTRRDLLGFLAHCGVRPRNSWSKERLAEVAEAECAEHLRQRMSESGVVEINPDIYRRRPSAPQLSRRSQGDVACLARLRHRRSAVLDRPTPAQPADLIEPLLVHREHFLGRHGGHARLSHLDPRGVVRELGRLRQ